MYTASERNQLKKLYGSKLLISRKGRTMKTSGTKGKSMRAGHKAYLGK